MTENAHPTNQGATETTKISVGGDVDGSIVVGNNNTTTIQKIINTFKGDTETTEQRNRRIMLNHVENFWIKGILEKSLHGAALLELGIKENPDALNYPWAIKREANQETLPAGTSMLEIFQEIGLGRSLLILGAPGSGKTTMLLELTRKLIERARQDVSEPIPIVFNLSSWTERLPLADWLAEQLNLIYMIPKMTAPGWVKENKMLLLLDGLDEVKQESRNNCVDAINQFRRENGLTNLAVCSRSQDYTDLKARLAFDGAIEIQPLTSEQVNEYINRLGDRLAGIRQVLVNDAALQEMAETPLFLSIMTLAYRDMRTTDLLVPNNSNTPRKHLFDAYIDRMFKRPRLKNTPFEKKDVEHWLSWLAQKMVAYKAVPYLLENMQPGWLDAKEGQYYIVVGLISGLILGLFFGLLFGLLGGLLFGLKAGLICWLIIGLYTGLRGGPIGEQSEISIVDAVSWDWVKAMKGFEQGLIFGLIFELIFGLIAWLLYGLLGEMSFGPSASAWLSANGWPSSSTWLIIWLIGGLLLGLIVGLSDGLRAQQTERPTYSNQRHVLIAKIFSFTFLLDGLIFGLIGGLIGGFPGGLFCGLIGGLIGGLSSGLSYGGIAIIQHSAIRFILARYNLLPWELVPFLDYCTDLIFLHRVGGGYIFVHRLLMEHFAAMYPEKE